MAKATTLPEVLTLAEAVRYLRVPKGELEKMATYGLIPARQFGKEWRFLKAALDDWLRPECRKPTFIELLDAKGPMDDMDEFRETLKKLRKRDEREIRAKQRASARHG